jgi:mannosyltransferase OCH1-like enzyme
VIEHWNGMQWQVVKSPSPGSDYNALTGVAVVSVSNVWAVGWQANRGITQTLIEHWNGRQWSVVKSPSPASVGNELFGVAAVSATNVWAVGFIANNTANGPVEKTLIEHWNGTQWSVMKSPSPSSVDNNLTGVAAVSANDVWAVGFYANSSNIWHTLTEHWNGTRWSVVKSPSPGSQINYFSSVAAVSTNDAWAVGYSDKKTLTEHWNGTQWGVVKSPGPGSVSNLLLGVAAVSASDIWTVGSYQNSNFVYQTLTEHWNGTQWGVVKSPSPGSITTQLVGVAAISPTDVWAVGHADSNTLIEHYC